MRRAVANGDEIGKICEDLMVKCLASDSDTGGIGCDNMTVVIVALLGGRTVDEWRAWVKERVENKGMLTMTCRVQDVMTDRSSWSRHSRVHPRRVWSSSSFGG